MRFHSCNIAGIFAYINFLEPKTRAEIIEILVNGLKRLEYRGYDSAGDSTHTCSLHQTTICVSVVQNTMIALC